MEVPYGSPALEKSSYLWYLAALLVLALLLLAFRPAYALLLPGELNPLHPEAGLGGIPGQKTEPLILPAPLPPQNRPALSSQSNATPIPAAFEPQPIPLPVPTPPAE